jgi:hypothetical protein
MIRGAALGVDNEVVDVVFVEATDVVPDSVATAEADLLVVAVGDDFVDAVKEADGVEVGSQFERITPSQGPVAGHAPHPPHWPPDRN